MLCGRPWHAARCGVAGKGAKPATGPVGTTAVLSLIAAGMVLSVAGEVIAFIRHEIGRSRMYHERLHK